MAIKKSVYFALQIKWPGYEGIFAAFVKGIIEIIRSSLGDSLIRVPF